MATGINQYLRKWSMLLNGKPFIDATEGRQFRCVFVIDAQPANTQSYADISIYGLAKTMTIAQGDDVIFQAGYEEAFDAIFAGTVTNVFRERSGPDIFVRMMCRSSGEAKNRGLMNFSCQSGGKLVDALKDIARTWPLRLEIDSTQFDDKDVFPAGWTCGDDPKAALEKLKTMFGLEALEDRGTLVITRKDKERSTNIFQINQFNGMVGIPEINRSYQGLGVLVTTRINPFIRTTSRIEVKSEFQTYNTGGIFVAPIAGDARANGVYNVLGIQYIGDTHGEPWDMRIDGLRAGTTPPNAAQNPGSVPSGRLVWGAKVAPEFRAKVREIAKRQNLDPNWYMSVMAFETGESFLPWEPNKEGSGAVGLIQFMPSTARGLGTSTKALANMSAVEQLGYVEKYLQQYAGQIKNLGDMYMAVFMPAKGIGVADATVLIDRDTQPTTYYQNRSLDINQDGKITRGEAIERVNRAHKNGMAHIG